jgi:hypothetical protein
VAIQRKLLWLLVGIAYLGAIVAGLLAWKGYQETSVLLEWTTASELDTAGFNVYRGQNPDGPYQKINRNLIPSSPDPITGGDYQYADNGVEPGQTYYYQLEEVEINGGTSRYGPREVEARVGGRGELIVALGLAITGLTGTIVMLRGRMRDQGKRDMPVKA